MNLECGNFVENTIKRELQAAKKMDAKARQTIADGKDLLNAEKATAAYAASQYRLVAMKWIQQLQMLFKGTALRRTVQSKDVHGNSIWDATDPTHHTLSLTLSRLEYAVLERMADVSVKDHDGSADWAHVSVFHFIR